MSIRRTIVFSTGVAALAVASFTVVSVTGAQAQPAPMAVIKVVKDWQGGKTDLTPTYKVACDSDAPFTATAAELLTHPIAYGKSCSISEVAVPNNGWVEQQGSQLVSTGSCTKVPIDSFCEESVLFVNQRLNPVATKSAFANQQRTWDWSLAKTVDQPTVEVAPGASKTVKYTITPSAVGTLVTTVSGSIRVTNVPWFAVESYAVTDLGTPVTDCNVPEDDSNTATITCFYNNIVVPNNATTNTAKITFTFGDDTEEFTASAPIEPSEGILEINRFAQLTDAYDGGAPVVLNPEVDALNPRVETYTKTYTNTPDNADDNDQDLQVGEEEIDDNVAQLTFGEVPLREESLKIRAFVIRLPLKSVVANARVRAKGLGSTQQTIPPLLLPNTTSTVAPTVAPTTTPTTIKAAELPQIQTIPTTVPVVVLGETIPAPAAEPAFTGSSNAPLVALGAAAIGLGGVLTLLGTRRRSANRR